jgi:peptidoglycan hydrolase CwlO-like protein
MFASHLNFLGISENFLDKLGKIRKIEHIVEADQQVIACSEAILCKP